MNKELIPIYTEAEREAVENKRELDERHSNGIQVIMYWLRKENAITIYLSDERTQSAVEFPVPNDEAREWFEHPYANPGAHMPIYQQNRKGEGYGA